MAAAAAAPRASPQFLVQRPGTEQQVQYMIQQPAMEQQQMQYIMQQLDVEIEQQKFQYVVQQPAAAAR